MLKSLVWFFLIATMTTTVGSMTLMVGSANYGSVSYLRSVQDSERRQAERASTDAFKAAIKDIIIFRLYAEDAVQYTGAKVCPPESSRARGLDKAYDLGVAMANAGFFSCSKLTDIANLEANEWKAKAETSSEVYMKASDHLTAVKAAQASQEKKLQRLTKVEWCINHCLYAIGFCFLGLIVTMALASRKGAK